MAKGYSAAQNRFETVVAGSLTGWSKMAQRLADGSQALALATDKTYLVRLRSGKRQEHVTLSNVTQTSSTLEVQLIRKLTNTSDSHSDDSLRKDLEADGYSIEDNLANPNNWDFSNTGVVLVRHQESEVEDNPEGMNIVWKSRYEVTIRRPSTPTTI